MKPIDPKNVVRIQPQGRSFAMTPLIPRVKAGYEPLVLGVRWSRNQGIWNKIVCRDFQFPDGTPCDVFPDTVEILLSNESDHTLLFNFTVTEETECKFTVEMHQVAPQQTIVIDPVIILQPGP